MSAIDPLIVEIRDDPLGAGYAGMSEEDVSLALQMKNRVVQGPVDARKVLRWSASTDGINSLRVAAASGNKDKRRLADAALAMLTSPHVSELDVSDAEIGQMLGALVALGVLTQADVDALKTRGQRSISRVEELNLDDVRPGRITEARKLLREVILNA